ncbi:glycosyltransferase family 4 protein [Pectinatus brassicae]|uniref:UDP-GlcNAc:undecaprenyl-phosphate GlcNAc-1-phosphate transferase n=1 Tax=Pectinatus brassicae TaxID=862415 RepID=A0A840UD98_9FIRM|nr:MraY family glycosyltransferase [Pectinatus brassicae]MBB5335066.1 UDP-GlcNAc:undecaprenyl-phosphate GlcNAc-1-phosphate transferase [Pectinatus brassicae]
MSTGFLAFIIALVIVLAIMPMVIKFAIKTGAIDAPDKRKVHHKPIPRIGGLGIYAGFVITIAILTFSTDLLSGHENDLLGLLLGGSFIVLVGIIDDYTNLPAKVKLLGQIAAACILVSFDVRIDFITNPFGNWIFLEYLSVPVTIFWIVGLTNTINLIDGLDGLAAGVSTIAGITLLLVAYQQQDAFIVTITAAIVGSALGFLRYNFNPARIFMGDTGSMFLGFILAGISIIGVVKSATTIALIVPILTLGLPILDTTFAIVRRYRGGIPIFKPDKGHLHHRLLDLGFTQRQAVLLMYVFSSFLGLSAIALTQVNEYAGAVILLFILLVIIYGAKKIGIFHTKNNLHV